MAPHSSTLAWKVPWTEEPGRLQSMGLWRVEHDWSDLAAAAATQNALLKTSKLALSVPFWCLCQKLSLSLLYFNKTLLHKKLWGVNLRLCPRLKSSPPEVTNPGTAHGLQWQPFRTILKNSLYERIKKKPLQSSLVVQCLELQASTIGGWAVISGQGTKIPLPCSRVTTTIKSLSP